MVIQDRYRIESLVAKGSMGTVYKATQQSIGRDVAIKVMHGYLVSDEESMKRYHKEAKAASRLNHPNITTVFDFGVLASGQPYIVMDLLNGKALSDILAQRGQLTANQTLMVMNQTCQALSEAHARGVVHRDIKPENIVIDELPDGRSIHVKVVDFGIAQVSQEGEDTIGKITKTGTVCGSPFYMSPEQCDGGKVDKRSDLYSLGIVLFESLTGKVPFESKDIYQVLTMQVKDPPPRLKKVRPDLLFSNELEQVVNKALAKEPDARFQTAQEFWQALAAAGGLKGGKRPEPTSSIMRPSSTTPPGTVPGSTGVVPTGKPTTGEQPVMSYAEQIKAQAAAAAAGLPDPTVAMASAPGSGATGAGPTGSTSSSGSANVLSSSPAQMEGSANSSKSLTDNQNDSYSQAADSGPPAMKRDTEELRKKIHDSSAKLNKSKTPPKEEKLSALKIAQIVGLPLLTVFVTVTLFAVMAIEVMKQSKNFHQAGANGSGDGQTNTGTTLTPEALMAQDKLEEARQILEDKKDQKQLRDDEVVTLDWVYIKLARREAKARRYSKAIALLEQVSDTMKEDEEVQSSMKRYKKQASK